MRSRCLRPSLVTLTLAATSLLVASSASADAPDCPASLVTLVYRSTGSTSFTTALTYDSTFTPIPDYPYVYARVAFDRTSAQLSVSAANNLRAGVRLVERFDVTGVPLGTPVSATLVYRLDGLTVNRCGGTGCGVWFGGRLVCGDDSTSANADYPGPCGYCEVPLAATLTLPVTVFAGTPIEAAFTMDYRTTWSGVSDAYGTGTYGISGLPPGVRAIACPGADVTPTRRSTWGGLKVLYR